MYYLFDIAKKVKLPASTNKRAKSIVDIATGEDQSAKPVDEVKAVAAELGRLGGLKGGKARANALSPKKRSEI